jgi:hypothetical protein
VENFGPEVRENPRAERPRHDVREIEDADAGERGRHGTALGGRYS